MTSADLRARPGLDGEVQQDREVGREAAGREPLDGAELVHRHPGARPLVRERRVGVAVAHDDGAAREGRADDLLDVLGARRREQERVGATGAVDLRLGVEDQAPDLLAQRRRAGLAGGDDVAAGVAERGRRAGSSRLDLPEPSGPSSVMNTPGRPASTPPPRCRV